MVRNLENRLERGRERADSFSLRRWIRVGSSLGRGRLIVMASLNAGVGCNEGYEYSDGDRERQILFY